jgi:hypothetical protein
MNAFLIVVPILLITGLFVVLSLGAFIDMRDPALQPERPAPRSPAQRCPRLRIHPYPLPYAHAFVLDSARPVQRAAQSKNKKRQMHTQTGIRWVKVKAGSTEGWVPAQSTVPLPGNENGVTTTPFSSSADLRVAQGQTDASGVAQITFAIPVGSGQSGD